MATALRSHALSFEVLERIDLDRDEMFGALKDFRRRLEGAEVGLFYYSGHAVQSRNSNYLLPIDTIDRMETEEDYPIQGIDIAHVQRYLDESKVGLSVIILDACRNNPLPAATRSASRGLAAMYAGPSEVIAYATAPNSVAMDGDGRNGTYTTYLLKHITDPSLSVLQMFNRVALEVKSVTAGRQQPYLNTSPLPEVSLAAG